MQFGWTSSSRNVVAIGHDGHGKTTLIAAIAKVVAMTNGSGVSPLGGNSARVEFETDKGRYTVTDYDRGTLPGGAAVDTAILVVSATDGPMPQTRDHLVSAREARVPNVLIFLNKLDLIDDSDLIDLIELEVRELVSRCGYPGDAIPMIRGSALKAVASRSTNPAAPEYQCIQDLLQAVAASGS